MSPVPRLIPGQIRCSGFPRLERVTHGYRHALRRRSRHFCRGPCGTSYDPPSLQVGTGPIRGGPHSWTDPDRGGEYRDRGSAPGRPGAFSWHPANSRERCAIFTFFLFLPFFFFTRPLVFYLSLLAFFLLFPALCRFRGSNTPWTRGPARQNLTHRGQRPGALSYGFSNTIHRFVIPAERPSPWRIRFVIPAKKE